MIRDNEDLVKTLKEKIDSSENIPFSREEISFVVSIIKIFNERTASDISSVMCGNEIKNSDNKVLLDTIKSVMKPRYVVHV